MRTSVLALAWLSLAAGCGIDNSARIARLRPALDRSRITLRDSVGVALTETAAPLALQAELEVTSDPVFSVGALTGGSRSDVQVDIVSGNVLRVSAAGSASDPCPGSVPLADAIASAEAAGGGRAVAIQPDDDDRCLREVQVLGEGMLWEVKVGRDGVVLEKEEYDGEGD